MPNVVLIHTHDSGRFVSPYGRAVPTPTIQRIADGGVTFGNAHCAGPTCSPSRSAVMTGQAPHENGMMGLAHRGFSLDDPGDHLASVLGEEGIETALCGFQHEARLEGADAARTIGYQRTPVDEYEQDNLDAVEHVDDDIVTARAAAEYVENATGDFFLSVGFTSTHLPFPDDHDHGPNAADVPNPLPDTERVRENAAAFAADLEFVDGCVETVYEGLDVAGLLDDTLVLFTTDHGPPFPLMKCDLRDSGTGISLVARYPDGPRGERTDALVSNVDLFPTILDFLDVPIPDRVHGHSLNPLVRGEVDSVRDQVFSEVTYHAAYEPKRTVRTDRYRLIRRYDDGEGHDDWDPDGEPVPRVPPNTDACPAKDVMADAGLYDRGRPRVALYDLRVDPNERENLAHDPDHAAVREGLAERLDSWMERTDDPLLDGPVSKPEGAVADARDNWNPGEGEYEPADAR